MRLRKFVRVIMFILVILGAIGGVGMLIPHHKTMQQTAPQPIDYSVERAFAAAFAEEYMTSTLSDTPDSRESEIKPFAGNSSWLGTDPAIVAPADVTQTVEQVLPGEVSALDKSHILVDILVHLSKPKDRWVTLIVPVGISGSNYDVYAPPTITKAFSTTGTVEDKKWLGGSAPADVAAKVQTVLQGFLPLYYQSTGKVALEQYLGSKAKVAPRGGLLSYVSISNLNVYGSETGPWIAVVDVTVRDPVTTIQYEEELAIGLELQDGHDLITGVVVN